MLEYVSGGLHHIIQHNSRSRKKFTPAAALPMSFQHPGIVPSVTTDHRIPRVVTLIKHLHEAITKGSDQDRRRFMIASNRCDIAIRPCVKSLRPSVSIFVPIMREALTIVARSW